MKALLETLAIFAALFLLSILLDRACTKG